MAGEFTNRHDWLGIAAALSVWAAHFTLLWGASIVFPGKPIAQWIAVVLTVLAFAALWLIRQRSGVRSVRSVEGLGIGIATVAVAYTFIPALIG